MKKTTIGRVICTGALVGVVGMSVGLPAWASKFYKWADEDGTTHYSAQPPRTKPSQEVNINVNTPSESDRQRARPTTSSQASTDEPASDIGRAAEIERQNREAIARNCETMRKNLATMTQHSRVRSLGADGEVTMLDEEERQARIKQAQDYINANCK